MRYLCFDNQIQTMVLLKKEGTVDTIEGAYQDNETTIPGTPYYVKCPWQFRFSTNALWNVKFIFGKDNDDTLKVYQNHPTNHATAVVEDAGIGFPNYVRMFYKTTKTNQAGIHPNDTNLADDYRTYVGDRVNHNMLADLDTSDYSLTYQVDMNIETNKLRLRSLPIVQDDFVANVMNRVRFAFPSKTTYLQRQEVVCVKFVPASRTYQGYEGYNNGMHLQFDGEGHKVISQRGSSNEEYLVFAENTRLSNGTFIQKGQPYKLSSSEIIVEEGTNMVLHIWKT